MMRLLLFTSISHAMHNTTPHAAHKNTSYTTHNMTAHAKHITTRLSLLCLITLLSACSIQPEWLQRKRNYPDWELSSRKVNQYSFHWEMTGDQAILPIQVFSTQDEVWLHFPEHATIPAIFEVDERWDLAQAEDGYTAQLNSEKPLRFHRNSPYIVLKGNPQRLRLRLGHYEAVIWHSPR